MFTTTVIDIKTLFVVLALVCLVLTIDLIFFWSHNRSVDGPKYWVAAMLCATIGSFLFIARDSLPLFGAVFFSTLFTIGGYAFFLRGIRAILKIRHGAALEWGSVGFSALYSCYFTLVSPSLVARIILFSVIAALLLFRCAYCLYQYNPAGKAEVHSFATASTFLLGAIFLIRALLAVLGVGIPATDSFMNPNLVTAIAVLGAITTYISLTIGLTSLPGQFAMEELRARAELKEKNLRDQTVFLQMVSHEYRTPLAIIQANIDLLDIAESDSRMNKQQRLSNMRQAVDRLKEIMETSLQRARLSDLHLEQKMEPVELVDFIDTVLDDAEGLWPEQVFVFQPEDGERTISGSLPLLKTALLNLLDNACKYSPKDSPVTIELATEETWAVLMISNVKQDICLDDPAGLFEKFQRGNNSSGIGGAGLGLWLVQQIINQHGGTITARQDTGTEFSVIIHFPLLDEV